MDHFRLTQYTIRQVDNRQVLILVTGERVYKEILARAFPTYYFTRAFEDRNRAFDWGAYIHSIDAETEPSVTTLLQRFEQHVFLADDLTECFALDFHTVLSDRGGYERSQVGGLVYRAKPYGRRATTNNREAAQQLAGQMRDFIRDHPTYRQADVIMPAPPSNPDKPFDLPTTLVSHIQAEFVTMVDGTGWVQKTRITTPMKDLNDATPQEKLENIRGAFALADGVDVRGKSILLIDDIYQSGNTLSEIGRLLFTSGAKSVVALVATKTAR